MAQLPVQHSFKLFFSWQNDVKGLHSAIGRSLKEAAGKLQVKLGVCVEIDEATRNVPGSPDIVDTLIKKIDACDVFVADVSPVASIEVTDKEGQERKKLIPNPNVMFELGYAVARKGWDRIILLADCGADKPTDLPFDINHNRTDIRNFTKGVDLTAHLEIPINEIIDNQRKDYPAFYSEDNLNENITYGKYLPQVYLHAYELRQKVRVFANPHVFIEKELSEVKKLSFDYVNDYFVRTGRKAFAAKTESKNIDFNIVGVDNLIDSCQQICTSLEDDSDTLKHDGNKGYIASYKIRRKCERFEFGSKPILMIRSAAGQGKTNFVCDLVQNILLPHDVPFIWLNGYQIDASDFAGSFLREGLHGKYKSLEEAMEAAAKLCHRIHRPLLLIIDGLNEVPYVGHLEKKLTHFLQTLLKHKFVRVVMTCREEYFKSYFPTYPLQNLTLVVRDLHNSLGHDKEHRKLLIDNYFGYFNIKVPRGDRDEEELAKDMLLLRIFCEVNRDRNLPRLDVRKYNLFSEYFDKAVSSLSQNLSGHYGKEITEEEIMEVFRAIISLMVESGTAYALPIKQLEKSLDKDNRDFVRHFLDENILVKRELQGNEEVVTFTYDEFRDFLIAKYLVEILWKEDHGKCLEYFKDASKINLTEGAMPFVFLHVRNTSNTAVEAFLSTQPWYDGLVAMNIWNLEEDKVKENDIKKIPNWLRQYPKRITWKLLQRWDTTKFKKLNVALLLYYLSSLDDSSLISYLDNVFPSTFVPRYYNSEEMSERESVLSEIRDMDEKEGYSNHPAYKYLVGIATYFSPFDRLADSIVSMHMDKTDIRGILVDIASNSKSGRVVNHLKTSLK